LQHCFGEPGLADTALAREKNRRRCSPLRVVEYARQRRTFGIAANEGQHAEGVRSHCPALAHFADVSRTVASNAAVCTRPFRLTCTQMRYEPADGNANGKLRSSPRHGAFAFVAPPASWVADMSPPSLPCLTTARGDA